MILRVLGVFEQQEDESSDYNANASQFPNDKVTTLTQQRRLTMPVQVRKGMVWLSYIAGSPIVLKTGISFGNIRRDGSSRFGLITVGEPSLCIST
jgi:hypothetical protein